MVKRRQLENSDLRKGEVEELKKQLNRYDANFFVMKNKGSGLYSVFCQAKDTKFMDLAFKKPIERYKKKENKRDSTIEGILKENKPNEVASSLKKGIVDTVI